MSNTYNALIHTKQDGTGEEVANNLSGGGGGDLSDYAKQEELSNLVLTGTTNTSGTTIAAGTCFVLNGDFVTAKTAIASGATFTLNTNYEKKSVGEVLGELAENNISDTIDISAYTSSEMYTVPTDGYVYLQNNTANQTSDAVIVSASSNNTVCAIGGNKGLFSVFVRKGMRVYPRNSPTSIVFTKLG